MRGSLAAAETARHALAKTGRLLANAPLALQAVGRGLADDPFDLLIKIQRRLPASPVNLAVRIIGFGRPGWRRKALVSWARDEPDLAREILKPQDMKLGRFTRRLANHLELTEESWEHPEPVEFLPKLDLKTSRPTTNNQPISVFHLLTNSLPYTTSGYSLRSHQVLLAQRKAGLRVAAATRLGYPVIIGSLTAQKISCVDGVTYHRLLPCALSRSLQARVDQAAQELTPIVEAFRADILSTTTDYTNALVAERVASTLGIPWTYEVRGLPEDTWVSQRHSRSLQKAAQNSLRYAIEHARETQAAARSIHLFTLGEALKTEFITRGIAPTKITTVNNATSVRAATKLASSQARLSLGLPADGLWVGSVSSLVAYEGFDTLIRATRLARDRGCDVRLLLVGDGVAKPELELLARGLALKPHVDIVFAGKVPSAAASRYYQALDLFAVPRRDQRVSRLVQPLKPLQACAAGVPLIVSDLPALRSFSTDGVGAVTVPPEDTNAWADTLCWLANNPETRRRLGRKAREFAEANTWEHEGQKYLSSYTEILRENSV